VNESPEPDHVEVEETTDEKSVFVVDPDEYHKTQRFKAIAETKGRVREAKNEVTKSETEQLRNNRQTAKLVVAYGNELLPLIKEGKEKGTLCEDDLLIKTTPPNEEKDGTLGHIVRYIESDGRLISDNAKDIVRYPSSPYQNPLIYNSAYRCLLNIEKELGLGIDLEEKKGPAEI
jgi:hypothetical protein